jgi:hypothetical protein
MTRLKFKTTIVPQGILRAIACACASALLTLSLTAGEAGKDAAPAVPDKPASPEKYGQSTPQKALAAVIAAIEARDFGAYVKQLLDPADQQRLTDKHGSLEKAAEYFADPTRTEFFAQRLEVMRKLSALTPTEGDLDGVKWAEFRDAQNENYVLRFHQQSDGRWCLTHPKK